MKLHPNVTVLLQSDFGGVTPSVSDTISDLPRHMTSRSVVHHVDETIVSSTSNPQTRLFGSSDCRTLPHLKPSGKKGDDGGSSGSGGKGIWGSRDDNGKSDDGEGNGMARSLATSTSERNGIGDPPPSPPPPPLRQHHPQMNHHLIRQLDSLWDHPLTHPPDRNQQCSSEIGLWVKHQQHKADPQWESQHQMGPSTWGTLVLVRSLVKAVPALAPLDEWVVHHIRRQ
ncbi:hypothetical protein Tco_0341126 [Tanacetum coccineum]